MIDGEKAYDEWDVIWYILRNEKWVNTLKNDEKFYKKIGGIIIAACRETKYKPSKDDIDTIRYQVGIKIKESA